MSVEHTSGSGPARGGLSRRSFFKVAVGSIVALPAVAGGFLLPADDPLGPQEAYADEGNEIKIVIARAYEAGLFVVDTKGGANKPVPGAKVTLYSHYNQKTLSGTTNDKGVWLADIRDLAQKENINGVDRYSLYAQVDVEVAGYRKFRSRRMKIEGAKGFQIPTRRLEGEKVYPIGVALDDWDILYTKNEFCVTSANDTKHTFTVDIQGEGNASITISICEGDQRKVVASQIPTLKDGVSKADLSDFFLLSSHKSALGIGSKFYLRYSTGGKDYEMPLQLSTVDAPTGVSAPSSTKFVLDPFSTGTMKPRIEVPKWVPVIGGTQVTVWTPDLPVEVLFNPFGYFKIAYRSEERGYKGKNGEPDPNAWKSHPRKTFEEQANAAWKERENTMKKIGQPLDREGVFQKVEVAKSISATAMLAAYAAGRWDLKSALWRGQAGIVGTLAFNFSYAQQFFAGPVPMVFEFSFLASLSLGVEVAVSTPEIFTPEKYSLDRGNTGISLTIMIVPAISLGVGVRGVLSVSVQGLLQFTFFVHWGPLPNNSGNRNVSNPHLVLGVTARISVVIQALIFTTSIPLKDFSYPSLYDNWTGTVSAEALAAESEANMFAEADEWDTILGTDFAIVPEDNIAEVSEFEISDWEDWEEPSDEEDWGDWITWGDGSQEEMDEDNWLFLDEDETDDHYDGFIYSSDGFKVGDTTGQGFAPEGVQTESAEDAGIAAEASDGSATQGIGRQMASTLVEETIECTTDDGQVFTVTQFTVERHPVEEDAGKEAAQEAPVAPEQAIEEAPASDAAASDQQPVAAGAGVQEPAAADLAATDPAAGSSPADPGAAQATTVAADIAVVAAATSTEVPSDAAAGSQTTVAADAIDNNALVVPVEGVPTAEEQAVDGQGFATDGPVPQTPAEQGQAQDEAANAAVANQGESAQEVAGSQDAEPEQAIAEDAETREEPITAEANTQKKQGRSVKSTKTINEIPASVSVSKLAVGNGIRPTSDTKIVEDVFGDPRAKVIKIFGYQYLFRISSVKVKDGNTEVSRTRVVAQQLNGVTTQPFADGKGGIIDFDIKVVGDKAPKKNVPKRADLYDYDFDITVGKKDAWDGEEVHIFIISGRRPDGDKTTMAQAASDQVFSHVAYFFGRHYNSLNYAFSSIANDVRYSATGKDDKYHSFSCPHIEYVEDGWPEKTPNNSNMAVGGCILTFLDRSSSNAEDLLKKDSSVHVGLGVILATRDYGYPVMQSVDTSTLVDSSVKDDKTIFEVMAFPPVKNPSVGNGQSSHTQIILMRGHEKVYYYLLCASMAGVQVSPGTPSEHFVPALKSLKAINAAFNGDAAKAPKRLVWWPGHTELLASVDSKLMKVKLNGAEGASPSLSYEECGPSSFAISAFGTDRSGNFIYWSTTQEGSPGYEYEKNPDEPQKAAPLPEIKRYQVLACKLRGGKFSDPFVFAEVEHDMDNMVMIGQAQESSAATFVSTHLSLDGKTGKPTGKADLWYTSVPHVKCVTVIGVECLSGVAFPGEPATFYVTVRNDGNTYLKSFAAHLGKKGNPSDRARVTDIVFSESTLMESCFNPKGDDGKLLYVEDDYALAPGKSAVYKVDFVIPKDWAGDMEVVVTAHYPEVAPIKTTVKAEGVVGAEAEETYDFDDSDAVEYVVGTSDEDWGDEGQPFDIVSFWSEDDLADNADGYDVTIADAPITVSGDDGSSSGVSQAARQATPRTADGTTSALPAALAAAGAGFVAYSRRRERLENEEE